MIPVALQQAVGGEGGDVPSSNIARFGYDAAQHALYVEFRSGGLYRYRAVPRGVFVAMQAAMSKGKFLHAQIKSQYVCEKIEVRGFAPDDAAHAVLRLQDLLKGVNWVPLM